jgi:hypothetical protein
MRRNGVSNIIALQVAGFEPEEVLCGLAGRRFRPKGQTPKTGVSVKEKSLSNDQNASDLKSLPWDYGKYCNYSLKRPYSGPNLIRSLV